MTTNPVLGYSLSQKLIHWLMAALIFFNLLFTEGMENWNRLVSRGETATPEDIASANVHAYVGIAILCLSVVRLVLRLAHGAPDAPAEEPPVFRIASKLAHGTFYLLFFLLPISGAAAYYFGVEAVGSLHGGPLKLLMWLLIVVHIAAVLVHQFYWKTPVAQRMTKG